MSTPTRYQQWSTPIMNGPLGYADPEEPDPDPSDPVDYASLDEGGAVQVGLDLGSVAIVNDFRILTSSTHPDWSSDFTPEAGNVLLVYAFQRNAGTAAAPTGWTRLAFSGPSSPSGSDTTISVYAKVSDGTETTMNYNIGVATARDYIILELSGVSLADYETNTDSGSTTSITSGSVTPTAGLDAIIIGAVAATPDEILGQSYTPGASYTELYDATGTAAPFETLYYQIVSPTSGSYDPDTTINNLAVGHTWRGLTVALVASSETAWYPAPAANDGDTATSAFGDATGACMRVALEVDRLIYRIDLDIGQETAGATVYEFSGTDDPSFASTTLLATLSFTATGSFTLDEVTESWVPAATFQYYELVHVSGGGSDREFYEVRLFSAVDVPGGGVTDHDDLTGRDAADQHPADAVTVDPSVNGETDVQGALEDHETRIDILEAGDVDEPVEVVAASGSTETIDYDTARFWDITLTDDCTFTITNPPADQTWGQLVLILRQGASPPHTVTWPAEVQWQDPDTGLAGGSAPTLFTTLNAIDVVTLVTVDGGVTWGGSHGAGGGAAALAVDDGTTTVDPVAALTFTGSGDATVDVTDDGGGAATVTVTVDIPTALPPTPLLLESGHAVPFTFDEILQESDGSDFLYASG